MYDSRLFWYRRLNDEGCIFTGMVIFSLNLRRGLGVYGDKVPLNEKKISRHFARVLESRKNIPCVFLSKFSKFEYNTVTGFSLDLIDSFTLIKGGTHANLSGDGDPNSKKRFGVKKNLASGLIIFF